MATQAETGYTLTMPRKGTSRVSDAQRQTIAIGRVAGKTHAQLAKETGLSRRTVEHQSIDSRTLTLMQEIKAKRETKLTRILDKGLDTLDYLAGQKKADPGRALAAIAQTHRIILLGDPPPRRIDPSRSREGGATLAELLEVYARFPDPAA